MLSKNYKNQIKAALINEWNITSGTAFEAEIQERVKKQPQYKALIDESAKDLLNQACKFINANLKYENVLLACDMISTNEDSNNLAGKHLLNVLASEISAQTHLSEEEYQYETIRTSHSADILKVIENEHGITSVQDILRKYTSMYLHILNLILDHDAKTDIIDMVVMEHYLDSLTTEEIKEEIKGIYDEED